MQRGVLAYSMDVEHFDVVVVGAGISGIGAGYFLQKESPNRSYVILEGRDDMGGTWDLFRYPGVRSDSDIEFGVFHIRTVLVPHDAREPCQFVISDGQSRFGMLTDVGHITAHLLREFGGLDALVLEFNHEPALLAASAYPPFLRERIAGPDGHLSNLQASEMLDRLDLSRLRTLVAAHLSEKTNCATLVAERLRAHTPASAQWVIARQREPLPWCAVGAATGSAAARLAEG